MAREVAQWARPGRRVEVATDDDAPPEARTSRRERPQVPDVDRSCERRVDVRYDDRHRTARDAHMRDDRRRTTVGRERNDPRRAQRHSAEDADPVSVAARLEDVGVVLRKLAGEVTRHRRGELGHAEDVRVRLCDETRNRREVGVSHFDVRDDKPQRSLRVPIRRSRGGKQRNPEHSHVDERKRASDASQPGPPQHEGDESRPDEHGDVLQAKDVRELEHPRHPVEQSEERRQADEQDQPPYRASQESHRSGPDPQCRFVVATQGFSESRVRLFAASVRGINRCRESLSPASPSV